MAIWIEISILGKGDFDRKDLEIRKNIKYNSFINMLYSCNYFLICWQR